MNETIITMTGNVAVEPVRVSADGTSVASFRIASNSRRFDRTANGWVDGETTWMTVTCFKALADNVLDSVRKGERVIVRGKLQTREWQKDERRGIRTELVAYEVGHDLSLGTTVFTKSNHAQRPEPGRAEADELATAMELGYGRNPFGSEVVDDRPAVLAERDGELETVAS
ncbi:MAG TPA: single-stranded DNA-binding protein [Actinomycetes bacterium]|nr:single-stranded DNA-binding protein [Actinomycetes bacterium]